MLINYLKIAPPIKAINKIGMTKTKTGKNKFNIDFPMDNF